MAVVAAPREVIDLTDDSIDIENHVIDLTEEGIQDLKDLIEQIQPEHEGLNGYMSDDNFVVSHDPGECAICVEKLDEGADQGGIETLSCGHSFHKTCINEWSFIKKACPECKHPF